jgi:divalent metal cation (Fe/Co/Zn/Cd) transporter
MAGLAVNGIASLVNAVWSWVLIRQGRRLKSPALMADGRHLSTDVMSSVGVLAGVALAAVTGWRMLDPHSQPRLRSTSFGPAGV